MNSILFTRAVLDAKSDSRKDISDVTYRCTNDLSSWPRYQFDLDRYSAIADLNFKCAYQVATGDRRVKLLGSSILAPYPDIGIDRALDFARQICSIFHEAPVGAHPHTELFDIGKRRCLDVGRLIREGKPDGQLYYVTSSSEQIEEWCKGNDLHNYTDGECCPDFACCNPPKGTPDLELRKKFAEASPTTRSSMLGMFLSASLEQNEGGPKVYVSDGSPNLTSQ